MQMHQNAEMALEACKVMWRWTEETKERKTGFTSNGTKCDTVIIFSTNVDVRKMQSKKKMNVSYLVGIIFEQIDILITLI